MTSNMGSALIRDNFAKMTPENKAETVEKTKEAVLDMLKQTIRPEFLNRIDEIIMFTPLNRDEIEEIVGLQIKSIQRMLAHSSGIELKVTPKALSYLADEGYDPNSALDLSREPYIVSFSISSLKTSSLRKLTAHIL